MVKIHHVTTWHVIFTNADNTHFVHRFLDPYFQHCYIIRREGDQWLVIDPKRSHIDAYLLPVYLYSTIRELIKPTDVSIKVIARIDLKKDRAHPCIINCVEVVKGFLGIKEPWVLTPLQLYNYLRK